MNANIMTLSTDYNHPALFGAIFSAIHSTLMKNDSAAVCDKNISLFFLLRYIHTTKCTCNL